MTAFRSLLACVLPMLLTTGASASWLSEITGIDLDLNRGTLSVKTPNLAAVPQMIQNLPKDVGQAMLNPASPVAATAIRFSRGQALNRGVQPIPGNVRQALTPYFPAQVLDKVRWTTKGGGLTIDAVIANWLSQEGAITLDDVIVFSDQRLANDIELWAHEMTHVLQYSQMGVETFAFNYTANWNQLEAQARDNASRVVASLNSTQAGQQRTWGYQGQLATSNSQLTWTSINQAARSAIPPIQCIWINNQTNLTGNNCPISIAVTGVVLRRLSDGYTFTFPCNEPTCGIGPNQVAPLLSPPGHLVVGISAAYER